MYDLVFVVAVAQLAHRLALHPDRRGVAAFAALFVPVWWAWTGQTFYANRFDADDVSARLLAGLQMLGVAVLAAAIPHALDSASTTFALAYVWVRAVLILQYVRAWIHVPAARPLTARYATGFSFGSALWLGSLALSAPGRHLVWVIALIVEVATPLLSRRYQASLPPQSSHLPERFGLFTIIVLGEGVASLVIGLEQAELQRDSIIVAVAGIVVLLGWWWVYFDNVESSVILRTAVAGQVWVYGHLPLVASLTAMAVGIEGLIVASSSATEGLMPGRLSCGAFAATALSIALLHAAQGDGSRVRMLLASAAAASTLALMAGAFGPETIALLLATLAAIQVVLDITLDRREARPPVVVEGEQA